MTQSDFFEKVFWQLFLNYNAFIIPTYVRNNKGDKEFTALYPIQPTDVTFLQDPKGKLGIKFKFLMDMRQYQLIQMLYILDIDIQ